MRIHIFGASGSGVTTLGKALSEQLNIEYFDSDDFFWLKTEVPFTEKQNPEIRNTTVSDILHTTDSWIFGGSIIHWGENIFPPFDLVIFLYLPPEIRMERLRKREFERYGEEITVNPERAVKSEEFLEWAKDYDHDTGIANRTLNAHREWLTGIDVPLLEISGDYPVSDKIKVILDRIKRDNLRLNGKPTFNVDPAQARKKKQQ
ncbi:adenylate kinase [Chryseobacterium arthrosphaerae]|uniref:AAA family ATPase n=1 Tax=Chryseobacterium arthrosphaerae TaxID=651561 RepID=UPI000F4F38E3|nr:AAA family ATPase [Chryseobacterium arthrosphaerae]AYZ11027.1 adenylate kinase [Chryseobacterium arthrosphaerae]